MGYRMMIAGIALMAGGCALVGWVRPRAQESLLVSQ
jgi:hypothetical protein